MLIAHWIECRLIGIGGHLAVPPLPHHRAYGSVPRRFDRVKLGQRHGVGGDRVSRNSGCAELVGPPGVRTCARTVVCVKFSKLVMVRVRWFIQVTRAASL